MKRLLVATALGLTSLLVCADAARAQSYGYNPYRSMYNNWNRSVPGYSNGGSDYRRQIRQMNPYGGAYRAYERETRRTYGYSGW